MSDVPLQELEPNPCRLQLEAFILAVLLLLGLAAAWRGLAPLMAAGGSLGVAGELEELCRLEAREAWVWEEQQRREALEVAGFHPGEAEQRLIVAWQALNLREAALGRQVRTPSVAGAGDSSQAEENAALAGLASGYVAEHGWDAWRLLGLHLSERFRAALAALEARSGSDRPRGLLAWVERNPGAPEVQVFQSLAGDYLAHAAVGERRRASSGTAEPGRHLPAVLFKVRWFLWTRDLRPPEMGLTRQDYLAYLAWKASGEDHLRPDHALQAAREMDRVEPGSRHALALGCQAARAGRMDAAATWFQAQLKLDPACKPAFDALKLLEGLLIQ